MYKVSKILILVFFSLTTAFSQKSYWQQNVDYTMEIDVNTRRNRFKGTQKLVYTNNSPDTINKVFYHLYFNAFQPGSMMSQRAKEQRDTRPSLKKISNFNKDEIGYQHIISLKQDGEPLDFMVQGTILEVKLNSPIYPGENTVFEMEFEAQVPKQTRRSGRDNVEGIRLSMSQWYPKICEYDDMGWHPNPYIGKEFYGVWGRFDVIINIDKDYILGATGYLQNPQEVGFGYEDESKPLKILKGKKLKWHFIAPNVHDFVWAADPDYKHTKYKAYDGTVFHFLFQETKKNKKAWSILPEFMDKALKYLNENNGKYPFKQYSFIQGGDGGMEYPMATLVTGNRTERSLIGVCVHEFIHSWYQGVLATNESLYPWMDEGFTTYFSEVIMKHIYDKKDDIISPVFKGMRKFISTGLEEPLVTHSDHYKTNSAYGVAAYTKGYIFLVQLRYILGDITFKRVMLKYFDRWKFKHPKPNDFIRIAEKESGLVLDWYYDYMINSTDVIDFSIESVTKGKGKRTVVMLKREGEVSMPIILRVIYMGGKEMEYYIPNTLMRGIRDFEDLEVQVLEDWPWVEKEYELILDEKKSNIEKVIINPTKEVFDIDPENDIWEK